MWAGEAGTRGGTKRLVGLLVAVAGAGILNVFFGGVGARRTGITTASLDMTVDATVLTTTACCGKIFFAGIVGLLMRWSGWAVMNGGRFALGCNIDLDIAAVSS